MVIASFIGRRTELAELRQQTKKRTSSLIVVKGRRRIGKSRLIEEFGKNAKCYSFSGLPSVIDSNYFTEIINFSDAFEYGGEH